MLIGKNIQHSTFQNTNQPKEHTSTEYNDTATFLSLLEALGSAFQPHMDMVLTMVWYGLPFDGDLNFFGAL